jgi:hypothetical protein
LLHSEQIGVSIGTEYQIWDIWGHYHFEIQTTRHTSHDQTSLLVIVNFAMDHKVFMIRDFARPSVITDWSMD